MQNTVQIQSLATFSNIFSIFESEKTKTEGLEWPL